jgi:hypothetical protein
MRQRSVYVILIPYKGNLWELSRNAHVWISDIEANKPQIEQVWAQEKTYSPNQGVTSFKPGDNELDKFYELLTTIDEHHAGEKFGWEEMVVQGIDPQEVDVNNIQAILDFKVDLMTENGIMSIRKRK